MKTADKNYIDDKSIAAGGDALGRVLDGVANIKNGTKGDPDTIINNTYNTNNTTEGGGTKTSTIIIVVAVLLVAVVGVVLFTRKS